MSSPNDWLSPDRLRAIATHLELTLTNDPNLAGFAGELRRGAAFTEDLEGAKQRKLEAQANMPESRAAMFNRTIELEKNKANAAQARVDQLEGIIRQVLPSLMRLAEAAEELQKVCDDEVVIELVRAGAPQGG